MYNNNLKHFSLCIVSLMIMTVILACGAGKEDNSAREEDHEAKKQLQGTWINDLEGNEIFTASGDSIFFNDSLGTPAPFYINNDTLYIEYHETAKYKIKTLNSSRFVFINALGDETELVKSEQATALNKGEHRGVVTVNQGQRVKADTLMTLGLKHLHAYTQVNPTESKVFVQTENNDGLSIESVYYDNLITVMLYDGGRNVFKKHFSKNDFAEFVPKEYLAKAILSEIFIEGTVEDGVRYVAVITIPNSSTNYRVNIDISVMGKKTLSL